VPNVQWKTPDDGQRNCPKHVEFLDKNKFGKLVHLLVLLKRKLHAVWSFPQNSTTIFVTAVGRELRSRNNVIWLLEELLIHLTLGCP